VKLLLRRLTTQNGITWALAPSLWWWWWNRDVVVRYPVDRGEALGVSCWFVQIEREIRAAERLFEEDNGCLATGLANSGVLSVLLIPV
jgi:hypothetical protein